MARARVFVDSKAGTFSEAGDLLLAVQDGAFALDRVAGEVGELVLGRVPGRAGDEVTVYKSVGAAFLDAATARLAYAEAVRLRVGGSFDFSA
jgi:ornithine cyclodeaminase/alanine dehydrogenase-like protein (mu-crystallin family)